MKRFLSLALVLCLILALSTGVAADNGKQHDYSTTANSGIRHQVCTSLLGTSAEAYYTGSYTYDSLSQLPADQLLTALGNLMTDTHTKKSTYNNCRDMAVKTDCQNGDGTTISLIYTSYVATWADWCNNRSNGWDREHVWPLSLGGYTKSDAPGCDLHHVRPSDHPVNNSRGNTPYGYAEGGKNINGANYTGNALGGTKSAAYFEPLDNVKGDVARICLYLYARYGSEPGYNCGDLTRVFESVDVLLAWCALDPVDTWEMGRNEVVAAFQGNRNVFIDYPELAWLLFDQEIPAGMTTPSGKASVPACSHSHTEIRNATDANCGKEGYSGDIYCTDCGVLLTPGSVRPATGNHTFGGWTVTKEATAEAAGQQERLCGTCGHVEREEIPKLEDNTPTTAPSTTPSTSVTQPSDPSTAPSSNATQPGTTLPQVPAPSDPGEEKEDYRWLVVTVIGTGAMISIAVVLIQTKRKK